MQTSDHSDIQSSSRRRRIGGYVEALEPSLDENVEFSKSEIVPLPAASVNQPMRKKRKSGRTWYRRPRFIIPVTLLAVLSIIVGGLGYQAISLMNSVQSVSTPPPIVTDNTYVEEGDPDIPLNPISVDTGPAMAYLEAETANGRLPELSSSGLTGQLWDTVGNSTDLVQGAAAAVGIGGSNADSVTILMMGVDAQPGTAIDIGVRPDVLAVLQLNLVTGTCAAVSIPRDTRVTLPGYGESKINHALMIGGIPYQLRVTEEFLNLTIDHYMLVDFVAFQKIVDSLGGVTVDVPEDLSKDGTQQFTQGKQLFDGETALRYTRFRSEPDGDLGRVERQWGVLKGISDAVSNRNVVDEIGSILPTIEDHIRTDLSATDMTQIAKQFAGACESLSEADVTLMRGTRVKLNDPILNQVVYFNVVEPAAIEAYIKELQDDSTSIATPVSLSD